MPTTLPSFGSLLCFNLFTSDAANRRAQDTRVSLTNLHETQAVTVRLVFVSSVDETVVNQFLRLSPNQTAVFFAAELDPGATGYLLALAVDDQSGCPRSFNALLGEAFVRLASGHAANLPAEFFALQAEAAPVCEAGTTTVTLRFDGKQFTPALRVLALTSIGSRADGHETLLVLQQFGGDLTAGAPLLGELAGTLYDVQGRRYDFTESAGVRQFSLPLSDEFPRTSARFTELIPAGQRGWLKLWNVAETALLGAAFNLHPLNPHGGLTQGHNLHKLALTTNATLTLPVIAPMI